jgi:hypothetical protein
MKLSGVSGIWYRCDESARWFQNSERHQYIHLGTREAAEDAISTMGHNTPRLYEIQVGVYGKTMGEDTPLSDEMANWIDRANSQGRPTYNHQGIDWTSDVEAVLYKNEYESIGSISLMVRASSIQRVTELGVWNYATRDWSETGVNVDFSYTPSPVPYDSKLEWNYERKNPADRDWLHHSFPMNLGSGYDASTKTQWVRGPDYGAYIWPFGAHAGQWTGAFYGPNGKAVAGAVGESAIKAFCEAGMRDAGARFSGRKVGKVGIMPLPANFLPSPITGQGWDSRPRQDYSLILEGHSVGVMQIYLPIPEDNRAVVGWINVNEEHRRKGVASAAFGFLRSKFDEVSYESLTDLGEKFWKSLASVRCSCLQDEPRTWPLCRVHASHTEVIALPVGKTATQTTLYHGTTADAARVIDTDGIRPNDLGMVYCTTNEERAEMWARRRAEEYGEGPMVVEILVDEEDVSPAAREGEMAVWGAVPPEAVISIWEVDEEGPTFEARIAGSAEDLAREIEGVLRQAIADEKPSGLQPGSPIAYDGTSLEKHPKTPGFYLHEPQTAEERAELEAANSIGSYGMDPPGPRGYTWEDFSRARGYSEPEIDNYRRYLGYLQRAGMANTDVAEALGYTHLHEAISAGRYADIARVLAEAITGRGSSRTASSVTVWRGAKLILDQAVGSVYYRAMAAGRLFEAARVLLDGLSNARGLGQHWSTDLEQARKFTGKGGDSSLVVKTGEVHVPVLIRATCDIADAVVDPEDLTALEVQGYGWQNSSWSEAEITLEAGAPVDIEAVLLAVPDDLEWVDAIYEGGHRGGVEFPFGWTEVSLSERKMADRSIQGVSMTWQDTHSATCARCSVRLAGYLAHLPPVCDRCYASRMVGSKVVS